jgi:hypothetical protein
MKPTSAQLAPNVIPIIREYVQASIEEALAPLIRSIELEKAGVEDVRRHIEIQKGRIDERLRAIEAVSARPTKSSTVSVADLIEQLKATGLLSSEAMASLDPTKKVI